MDQSLHTPEVYDFRQYDRIWQRVAPNLEPYPGMNQAMADPSSSVPMNPVPAGTPAAGTVPAAPSAAPAAMSAAQPQQEGQLPGAEQNPCCMGSAALEMLDVLAGYIEEALSDRRSTMALVRQAPSWARQRLRDIAAGQASQARRLMAAYYLITGECYRPSVNGSQIIVGRWCPALRERYHAAACSGFNYARSADDTTDPCLTELLNELSADSYRHAGELMRMLERSLQGQ